MGRTATICIASILFGCGSVKDSGGPVDAAVDAGPDADLTGMATVKTEQVLAGGMVGAVAPDIDIVSTLPNNTVLETKKTGSDGTATIRVYPGGSVTAIYKHTTDMGADLISFVGVKPNDDLTFGSRTIANNATQMSLGSQSYSWPALANAVDYRVQTSCGSSFTPVPGTSSSIQEFNTCNKQPMDALFFAVTNVGGTQQLSHFGFLSNMTFMNGVNRAIGGWQAFTTGTVNISGLPPEVTSVSGQWSVVFDGDREAFVGSFSGQLTGGTFIGNPQIAQTGERLMAYVFIPRIGMAGMTLIDSLTPGGNSQTVSSPALPPFIQRSGSGPFTSTVITSAALGQAAWFSVPSGPSSTSDWQLLRMFWNRTVSGMPSGFNWQVIMPPTQTNLSFPKLPPSLADFGPLPTDNISSSSVRHVEIPSVMGYDAARAIPSRNLMCVECALRTGEFQRAIFSGN